jgi:hypothetical protein
MTSEIPRPNSIWTQRATEMEMRVTPGLDDFGNDEVSANNVELAMRFQKMELLSWRGSLAAFYAEFIPSDCPYPRLAG